MSDSKKEKIIYLIRHGQTAANVSPVFQSPDEALNENGRAQAENVAARVAKLSFDSLIASPFQRTKETAEAIEKATGKTSEYSDLFVERIHPTSIYGRPFSDENASATNRDWVKSMYTSKIRVEDGENFDRILIRVDNALEFLAARDEMSLVVITHNFILRTIIARVLLGEALTPEAYRHFMDSTATENTGITVLRYFVDDEGKAHWKLWIFNDHTHLG